MMLVAIFAAGIVFYETFVGLKTLAHVTTILDTSKGSMTVVQSITMSDEEKATAMQQASVKTISALFMMVAKLGVAIAVTGALLYAISLVKWSFEDLLAYSIKPLPLIATIVFLIAYGYLRHGRRAGN